MRKVGSLILLYSPPSWVHGNAK